MFNDKLGQISLDRGDRKNKVTKKRITQNASNYKNANSYSLDPMKRHAYSFVSISSSDVFINYEEHSPKNDLTKIINSSFGEEKDDAFSSFNDTIKDLKERNNNMNLKGSQFETLNRKRNEYKNAKYDVLKRNSILTRDIDNKPFNKENLNAIKVDSGDGLSQSGSGYLIVSNVYKRFDSKDPFIDSHSQEVKDKFYFVQKNYYNNGKSPSFSEKDSESVNSIINEMSNDKYFKTDDFFATSGFTYKSNRPDSIAFGGLKR